MTATCPCGPDDIPRTDRLVVPAVPVTVTFSTAAAATRRPGPRARDGDDQPPPAEASTGAELSQDLNR